MESEIHTCAVKSCNYIATKHSFSYMLCMIDTFVEGCGHLSCIPSVSMTSSKSACSQFESDSSVVEKLSSFVKLVSPFRKPTSQCFW